MRAEAQKLLDFVGLGSRAGDRADSLTYGQLRLLELARALACKPQLLLLDEPAAGFDLHESETLAALIRQINERGVGVLLIEHDMGLVMSVARRIVVLDSGRVIAQGSPDEVKSQPDVIAAYLGGNGAADA